MFATTSFVQHVCSGATRKWGAAKFPKPGLPRLSTSQVSWSHKQSTEHASELHDGELLENGQQLSKVFTDMRASRGSLNKPKGVALRQAEAPTVAESSLPGSAAKVRQMNCDYHHRLSNFGTERARWAMVKSGPRLDHHPPHPMSRIPLAGVGGQHLSG